MSRTLAITYAGLVLGAGQSNASYHLTGKYSYVETQERADLAFEVVVQNEDDVLFLAAEAALLTAYRTPDAALLVVIGGGNRRDLDPADNTGFNARASARKVPGLDNTARSARYACSVSIELPADTAGRAGRRSSSVDVSTSPAGRRSLSITGVYTALSNNAARAQFESQVATYAGTVTSGLGGTWELVGTPSAKSDDQNKTISFSRAYREVIYHQAQSAMDHPAIVEPRLQIARTRTSAESTRILGSVEALKELQITWSASVAIAVTVDLEALWEGTVRPHLIAEAELVGGGAVVVTRETPLFDAGENTIAAAMTVLADSGAKFLRASVDVADSIDMGVVLKPVWDGNPFSRDKYKGSGSHVRTLTRRTLRVAATGIISKNRVISDHGDPPQFSGFVEVRESRRARAWNVGVPGTELTLRSSETVYVYVRADDPKASTGSGGGGTRTRPQKIEAGSVTRGAGEVDSL